MSDKCDLRAANGRPGEACDQEECIYWRAAEYLGADKSAGGCAIQHFRLLGDEDVVRWLLSVKERVETTDQPDAKAESER